MTLGAKIQALRTDAGMSQEALAERLAVSRQVGGFAGLFLSLLLMAPFLSLWYAGQRLANVFIQRRNP